jgi:hypothetical protein
MTLARSLRPAVAPFARPPSKKTFVLKDVFQSAPYPKSLKKGG